MLELRQLSFNGIGRFVEEQSIDFSLLNEFIQVDGQNNNTNGSSGSGKTTVFNALDYLLGLNDIPSTILQSRYADGITVTGTFVWDGIPMSLTRGKKLKLVLADRTIEGSSALVEEEIDKILGMPRKIFRKLLHKRQKEGGFFLDFTPAKMHEFLIDCLNLEEYRKHYDKQTEKIKDLLAKKLSEETFLSGQEVGLSATRDAITSLGPAPSKDVSQGAVIGLKKRMEEAENELRNVLAVHNLNKAQLERERPDTTVVQFDSSMLDFHKKTINDLNAKLNALFQDEKDRQAKVKEWIFINDAAIKENDRLQLDQKNAHKEAMRMAAEIRSIRTNTCPTCKQQWLEGKTQEETLLKKITDLKPIMDKGAQAYQDRFILDKNTVSLNADLVERFSPDIVTIQNHIGETQAKCLEEKHKENAWVEKQNEANRLVSSEFAHRQRTLALVQEAEANQARGQLDLCRRVFDSTVNMLKASVDAAARYETNLTDLKAREEKFTNKIAEVKSTISATEAELTKAEETCKAIKTFLSCSFDDALEEIGENATKIIRCIPNTSNATIQFDGTKETKDGKVKEEVTAVIGMDGEEAVPIKSLSGGERTAIDIAVDLAVIDFIETKSGKGINIFVLDEPFTGLGPVEIEMALDVLKNSNTNKKIVIVDHNSEVKQMVQDRLVVVRDGLTSKIEKDTNV